MHGGAVQYGYLFPAPVDPVKRYLCFEFVDYCCFPLFDHVMPDAVPISEIMHIRPDEFLQPSFRSPRLMSWLASLRTPSNQFCKHRWFHLQQAVHRPVRPVQILPALYPHLIQQLFAEQNQYRSVWFARFPSVWDQPYLWSHH